MVVGIGGAKSLIGLWEIIREAGINLRNATLNKFILEDGFKI